MAVPSQLECNSSNTAYFLTAVDLGIKIVVVLACDDIQNPVCFSQYFRADTITGQPRYARFHVLKLSPDLRLSFCDRQLRETLRTPFRVALASGYSPARESGLRVHAVRNACRERSCCAARQHAPAT